MKLNQSIGIFDSGIGGLVIAKAIKNIMPNESIIYFADLKNLPYGNKSKKKIIEYSKNITNFLLLKQCKVIVVACNTVSANALEEIKNLSYNKALVFDVISPVIEKLSFLNYNKVGVIGTESTINSHIYKINIQKINSNIQIFELATPLLVPIIEQGPYNRLIYDTILEKYLSNFRLNKIDILILGCTHYLMILYEISRFFNHVVKVCNSSKIVANYLFSELGNKNLLSKQIDYPQYEVYFSNYSKYFEKITKIIFGHQIIFKKIR